MKSKVFFWQLYPSYLLIILTILLPFGGYAGYFFQQHYLVQIKEELKSKADFVVHSLSHLPDPNPERLNSFCKKAGQQTSTRITLIQANGKVIGESDSNSSGMENHADRPEFQAALKDMSGISIRFSSTLKMQMLYVAVPMSLNHTQDYVVRVAIPLVQIEDAIHRIYLQIAFGGLILLILAFFLSFWISRRISLPIEKLEKNVRLFSEGKLDKLLRIPDVTEMASLAQTMNQMASTLNEQAEIIEHQSHELDTVLSSMKECVLVIDSQESILKMNVSAANLFEISADQASGRFLQEVIRNMDLHQFARKILETQSDQQAEITLEKSNSIILQAHGSILKNAVGDTLGALIVLNEITQLHQLKTRKKDFVANVSHELKTPVTSIKGSVEALKGGAIHSEEDAERFLSILSRQTERLISIIEDLLSLSHLEEISEKMDLEFTLVSLSEFLEKVVQESQPRAHANSMSLESRCSPEIMVQINPSIFEGAIINLLDNAINYSQSKKPILVSGIQTDDEIQIAVQDFGCGIAKQHQELLFERFYRIDKSRSRKIGGTGLGLSIVKHIVSVHGGYIEVSSALEQGSIFTIHLPKLKNHDEVKRLNLQS